MYRFASRQMLYLLLNILIILAILFMLTKISPILRVIWDLARTIAIPFFIGVVIAYLLNPLVVLFSNKGMPRAIAVLLIYATFIVIASVTLLNAIPVLIAQFKDITEHLPELARIYQNWMAEFQVHKHDFPEGIQKGLEQGISRMEQQTSLYISGMIDSFRDKLETFFLLAIVPFVIFYLLKDMKSMQRMVLMFVPGRQRKPFTRLVGQIDHALGNYIRGQLMVCAVVGGLAYAGYFIVGLPYAFILALIVGITNIIPYLGPFIGAAPAILVAFTISWKLALSVAVVNIIIQILEGSVVSPLIVGKTLNMHPLAIIFTVILGGEIAGLPGMILSVPILAVIKVIIHHTFLTYVRH